MTTFYILRHGETENNINEILQGCTVDSPLTKKGQEQAKRIAKELSHIHFDGGFSSDLSRAKRTAEIITLERKLAIKTTQALREQCYGKYEGQPYEVIQSELKELLEEYERLNDGEKWHFQLEEGMETDAQAGSRFITFIREIAVAYPTKTILLVSHGDVIKYFLIHIGYTTYSQLGEGSIENCSYVKIQSDGVDFFVKETKGIHLNFKRYLFRTSRQEVV